ncbi:unnamed protein product [Pleuronectes platessa]|uniref:Uncharacterized protein n=1 Tax=Pleuronectes platessa TaxID=8262 RepID=A0A9N7THX8_PLEPL|nr:unnamed protein product [Pleuronectes platessa]
MSHSPRDRSQLVPRVTSGLRAPRRQAAEESPMDDHGRDRAVMVTHNLDTDHTWTSPTTLLEQHLGHTPETHHNPVALHHLENTHGLGHHTCYHHGGFRPKPGSNRSCWILHLSADPRKSLMCRPKHSPPSRRARLLALSFYLWSARPLVCASFSRLVISIRARTLPSSCSPITPLDPEGSLKSGTGKSGAATAK